MRHRSAQVIAQRPNVCKQLHMPAQSGSSAMLARMKRGYTRDAYDALVTRIRERIPGVALSTDIIAGTLRHPSHESLEQLGFRRPLAP